MLERHSVIPVTIGHPSCGRKGNLFAPEFSGSTIEFPLICCVTAAAAGAAAAGLAAHRNGVSRLDTTFRCVYKRPIVVI
jgi:hypothetical protein